MRASDRLAVLDCEWKETLVRLQAAGRIEPVAPKLANPSIPCLLRGLDLPDPIEDELIKLFGDDNWKVQMKAGSLCRSAARLSCTSSRTAEGGSGTSRYRLAI